MLKLEIQVGEHFDEDAECFVPETVCLELEHSLLSMSRWEEKYMKPFLNSSDTITSAEVLDYVKMMVVSASADVSLLNRLTESHITQIQEYLNRRNTATTIADKPSKPGQKPQIVTSELIYYWMFSLRIPKECEEWNLNRLLTLIRVFDAKTADQNPDAKKKINQSEIMRRNRELNAKRLKGGKRG